MMKKLLIYILFIFPLFSFSQIEYLNAVRTSIKQTSTSGYDTDAQAIIDAAGTFTSAVQDAINDLVVGFKANGTWTKKHIIYGFAGDTESEHKWNYKNPTDSDSAFRGTFSVGWTHNASGVTPNGVDDALNTHYVISTEGTATSFSWGIYYGTTVTEPSGDGTKGSGSEYVAFYPNYGGDFYSYMYSSSSSIQVSSVVDERGMWTATQVGGTAHKLFHEGTQQGATNTSDQTASFSSLTSPVSLGSVNRNGIQGEFSTRTIKFFYIGEGHSDAEVAADYTVIQAFQTALSRAE